MLIERLQPQPVSTSSYTYNSTAISPKFIAVSCRFADLGCNNG